MDFIVLMAFSNWGVAQFVPAINNPGGRAYEVDYTMPDANKLVSVLNWTTANVKAGKLNPILFLSVLCAALRARGVQPGEILMSQELATWLRMNDATRLLAHGTDKQAQTVTKSEFSALLEENEIPPITVIQRKMGISPDGKRQAIEPWNPNFIAIKPAGVIGEIQPAIEDSELIEEENVDYLNAGNGIRISKWRTGASTGQTAGEYTEGAGRLLPLITEIGQIVCLQVRGLEEKEVAADANGTTAYYRTKADYDAAVAAATLETV